MSWNVVDKYGAIPTGAGDNTPAFEALAQDLKAAKVQPKVIFPEGVYDFSVWPDMAVHNLQLVGEGEVYLRHIGTGDAMTFDGNAEAGGKFNLTIDNLRLIPNINGGADGLSLKSIHHSYVNIRVLGVGAAGAKACGLYWCVLTELYNYSISKHDANSSPFGEGGVGTYDCFGLWLDKVTVPNDWQTTACRFTNPIIEYCATGIHIEDAGGCQFTGGSIEYCTGDAFTLRTGGNNQTWALWLEGNAGADVVFGRDTHDNLFHVTNGDSDVVNNAFMGGNNRVLSPSDRAV